MRIEHVMLAAAVVLWMTTGQGEAQEIGEASHGNGCARNVMLSKSDTRDLPMRMRLDSRLLRPRRA
jgi:hypothetical protein